MYTYNVKITRPIGTSRRFGYDKQRYNQAVERGLKRLASEVIEYSQLVYAGKRKSANPVSMVIDSFLYKSNVNNEGFVLDIICGGASAPHAKYVEYPRPGFPGYFFMLAGKDYGAKRIGPIIKEEIRNEFNI